MLRVINTTYSIIFLRAQEVFNIHSKKLTDKDEYDPDDI